MVELNLPLACRARPHQADNLAKLRREDLSVLELIAQILCAIGISRTSAVFCNRHKVSLLFRGYPHCALNDKVGDCYHRNEV